MYTNDKGAPWGFASQVTLTRFGGLIESVPPWTLHSEVLWNILARRRRERADVAYRGEHS